MTQVIETVVADSALTLTDPNAALEALLNEIGDDTIVGEPIITEGELAPSEGEEAAASNAIAAIANVAGGDHAVDALLDEIGAAANLADMKKELYAAQPAAGVPAGEVPPVTTADLVEAAAKGKKGGKGKKKAEAGAEGAEAAAKPAKEKKAPAPTSVTHKPGDLLKHKLGEKAGEYLMFSLADATLDPDALAAKQQAFIDRMNDKDAIADKVRDKISMFLVWMVKGGELNEVLKRSITLLHKEGQLTSGDKGNLQLNLLEKPYSVGTARSQGNQMFMALPELGLTLKEKGRMVPNPDSALLPMAYNMLGLA
ncbi:hypothetical protein [Herbaspirillum huttiense]|uniref:Virion structural protein n=1 Tax=Herbaspirillum huttiense subsp. lycopersici TaxID=3074428 RepID=A0ABU2EG19_9BURK|nr:hypothetical protein [Herbaspirillum huttiense]MDR9847071.1 hypothetical protein [Herbaspirillum huttiense SE1]